MALLLAEDIASKTESITAQKVEDAAWTGGSCNQLKLLPSQVATLKYLEVAFMKLPHKLEVVVSLVVIAGDVNFFFWTFSVWKRFDMNNHNRMKQLSDVSNSRLRGYQSRGPELLIGLEMEVRFHRLFHIMSMLNSHSHNGFFPKLQSWVSRHARRIGMFGAVFIPSPLLPKQVSRALYGEIKPSSRWPLQFTPATPSLFAKFPAENASVTQKLLDFWSFFVLFVSWVKNKFAEIMPSPMTHPMSAVPVVRDDDGGRLEASVAVQ
ncbi:hypothetical protein B0H19DRAFT_1074738 [Mycena capillaripes]|nr:hypothetical protein B0H19DRAFT_1074738 [Mycena capillaripes]